MKKHKRITPKLTDLKPDSVVVVFKFLEDILHKHSLDFEDFKKEFSIFSVDIQHFIIKYAIVYFDYYNPKSYLRIYLNQLEINRLDFDDYYERKNSIKYNWESVIDFCKTHKRIIRNQLCKVLIHNSSRKNRILFGKDNINLVNEELLAYNKKKHHQKAKKEKLKEDEFFNPKVHKIKIPLIIKVVNGSQNSKSEKNPDKDFKIAETSSFLPYFKSVFESLLSKEDYIKMVRNSFRSSTGDPNKSSIEFLNLSVKNKSILYEAILKSYKYYKSEVKISLKSIDEKSKILNNYRLNREASNLTVEEKSQKIQLLKQKDYYKAINSRVKQYHFLSIFFFSFPIIRESFLNYAYKQKKDASDDFVISQIPVYLEKECKNLKMRKKSIKP